MKKNLLQEFEIALLRDFDVDTIHRISNMLTVVLDKYEVTQPCRELITYEDINEQLMQKYVACMLLEGKAEKTIKIYAREMGRLVESCNKRIVDITTMDIRSYFANMLTRGVSKRSVNNCKNYLSSVFKWLENEGEIPKSPMQGISSIKYEKVIKEPFTDIEIDAIRTCKLSLRDRALVEFLLSSGVRINELCNLNRSDIDMQTLRVHIRNGKGGKDRITFINNVCAYHLKKYLSSRQDNREELFLTCPNKQECYQHRMDTNSAREVLREISRVSGVKDIHPHKFRHSFATSMYNRGMDIHEVQKLLGHNSIETTTIYISTNDASLEQSYKRII